MLQFEVELALQEVAQEVQKWKVAYHDFLQGVNRVMDRLIHEAVANRMSVEQIAGLSGLTKHRIRRQMKQMGLDYRTSKTALAHSAAEALKNNAALLGVDPLDMDLSSPLAYLPGGSQLRTKMQSEAVKGVKDLDEMQGEIVLHETGHVAEHVAHCTANTCCVKTVLSNE
jgi:hypothetical protein